MDVDVEVGRDMVPFLEVLDEMRNYGDEMWFFHATAKTGIRGLA